MKNGRRRAGALLGVVVAISFVLGACSEGSTESGATTRPTPASSVPSSTSTTTTSTTAPPSSSTTAAPSVPPPCEPDMGSTLQAQHFDIPRGDLPGETRSAPEEGFDWDQDGNPDRLVIGEPDGVVTLEWGTGSLTVTGINTDFTQPVTDADGREYVARNTGPGSAEEIAEAHRPAAVGDVTGDGWLDLVVTNRGTAAVLAGAGGQTRTGTIAFDQVGLDTPGWQSPPERSPQRTDASGNPAGTPALWPAPNGDVSLWSDGSGVDGFSVSTALDRALGPLVLYAGIPCSTRPG
jgi:hypothetical protein